MPRLSPTLADLKTAARQHGAAVDTTSLFYGWVNVDAPAGKVWASTGDIHALCVTWHAREDGRPEWPQEKADAIADAIKRMSAGLADCDDPDCDVCHPEGS